MLAASFWTMLVFYAVECACIVAVAVAGVFVGQKIRDRKDKKIDQSNTEMDTNTEI